MNVFQTTFILKKIILPTITDIYYMVSTKRRKYSFWLMTKYIRIMRHEKIGTLQGNIYVYAQKFTFR